ncbi:MAG: cation:dicarboxylate symporter family transporter, partial [Planctomycetaceae bacterium]
MTGTARMFLGLVGGAAAGLVLARLAPAAAAAVVAVAEPVGTLWLHALQMTVVPLIVSLLVVGVAQAADIAATGRIARRSLAWILVLSTAAAALSAVITPRFLAAMPRSAALAAALDDAAAGAAAPAGPQPTAAGRLTALVPTNVVAAAASGAVAPLVVFTLCFALALATLEPARRDPVVGLAQAVADAMTRIVGWVLRAGPIGVAALILPVTVRAGGAVLGALGIYVLLLVTVY